jgi:hypothetical protein|tara:strand:+ start:334 stop:528 length:195 start_codon:yes stop_codon:yes gene_type:complete
MNTKDHLDNIKKLRSEAKNLALSGVVVPKGTLCLDCEKNPALAGYDLHFCEECWENAEVVKLSK